ncbi:MAG TPA: S-methyl-5'-thioadenosine phosphorylase [Anaerolineae bacterium]|nr:S-methyl-5'-thioadenosine phosphorylase [Anaerolineae bacterium]
MPKLETVQLAVIGGSGLYQMESLTDIKEYTVKTPFGDPSDAVLVGTLAGRRVAFLPRHGRGHRIMPTEVNSRANIFALKTLGVTHLVSVSACGSLREDLHPRHVVVPDQLFDRTRSRPLTFFGRGLVVHVGLADPFCPRLSALVADAVEASGGTVHRGGTFVTVEGPRFSTRAESKVFRQLGFDIIGMTAVPEANLAREAEMAYAVMAHVTDFDVWHASEEAVTVERIIRTLNENVALAKRAIERIAAAELPPSEAHSALAAAIITSPQLVPDRLRRELAPLLGKYLPVVKKSRPKRKGVKRKA